MINEATRQAELAAAEKEAADARARWEAAKTRTAKREAAETLEFWTNKTAFWSNVRLA